MSSRGWVLRVEDILRAIATIQRRTEEVSFEAFASDDVLVESVLYQFIIIGEASANIPENIQTLASNLPWRLMSDMRNIMAHEYFQVNVRIAWETAQEDLPRLVEPLQELLEHYR